MLRTGQKIRFFNRDVVVLICSGNEVLIYINERHIKWVDEALLDIEPQLA